MMSDELGQLLEEDVADSTDFPTNTDAPGLRSLDEALRCTICRELFEAPVTVNCSHGHCFCSLCIREHMNTKHECPLCRQPILEVYIRRNQVVEDAVKAWRRARPFVLGLLKEDSRPPPAIPLTSAITSVSPASPSKKRKFELDCSDGEVVEVAGPNAKNRSPKQKRASPDKSAEPVMVQCPVCTRPVAETLINQHLDSNCKTFSVNPLSNTVTSPKSRKTQQQAWSRLLGGEPAAGPSSTKGKAKKRAQSDGPSVDDSDPLPKMAYDTVSTKVLRDRLAEYSLPNEGERQILITRHQRWVIMFNANLDASASERRTAQQLRKELKRWEDNSNPEKTRKTRPAYLDVNTYVTENRAAFAQLIAKAGGSRTSARSATNDIEAGTAESATQQSV